MRRIFIGVAGVCMAVGLALQSAQAGERKHAAIFAVQARASHGVAVAAPARSSLRTDNGMPRRIEVGGLRTEGPAAAGKLRTEVGVSYAGHGDLAFAPVSPLGSEVRGQRSEVGSGKGPKTTPRERKSLTFFRLDPKFGDVSVQPVVGGVNGAQVSLGF